MKTETPETMTDETNEIVTVQTCEMKADNSVRFMSVDGVFRSKMEFRREFGGRSESQGGPTLMKKVLNPSGVLL